MFWQDANQIFDSQLPIPQFQRVKQTFAHPQVTDIPKAVFQAIDQIDSIYSSCQGKRIAITAGSRGISGIVPILAAIVMRIRDYGGDPFIVPAMGSHGGATAQGQVEMLANLGITEVSTGAPILSSMEVVEVGNLANGMPIYLDRIAANSDGIVIVNRIKPHTDFIGEFESGLAKMSVLGLGKQKGAAMIHSYGTEGLQTLMPQAARLIVQNTQVLFGLASIENAYHQVAQITAIPPEGIGGPQEAELLETAYALMPHFPVDDIDVLIVEEMGKNISGVGMDPKVIGRVRVPGVPNHLKSNIHIITVLNLTPETHGNSSGIGLADVTTRHLVEEIDFNALYVNCITAGICGIQRAAIPLVAPDDRAAIRTALQVCGSSDPLKARVVRIKNTLSLEEIDVSESLVTQVLASGASRIAEPFSLAFDERGRLAPFYQTQVTV